MKYYLLCISFFCLFSCKQKDTPITANTIISKAIDVRCQGNCDEATIHFTFRNKEYTSKRENGQFEYSRIATDSINVIKDVLNNKGVARFINNQKQLLTDSISVVISEAVNSVHYFAQLPYGLEAPAVQSKLLGETTIKETPYYKIEVSFTKEGGGVDFEDVFIYWIHTSNYTVDYLAYKYAVNGGGMRFREAYNSRVINGIRFVDYNNYKPISKQPKINDLDSLFEINELKLLSKIETEDVRVLLN